VLIWTIINFLYTISKRKAKTFAKMHTSCMKSHYYKLFSIVANPYLYHHRSHCNFVMLCKISVCCRNTIYILTGRLYQNTPDYHNKKIILKFLGREKRKKHPKVLSTQTENFDIGHTKISNRKEYTCPLRAQF
jgi:hypothetical protein